MSKNNLAVESNMQLLNGQIKHCARNAYTHLRKSWMLHYIDNEMSLFRAITAEEEAATALMLALKQKQYPNAKQLNHRNHTHKSAFTPFITAVNNVLAKTDIPNITLNMSTQGRPKIFIRLDMQKAFGSIEPIFAEPDSPLNFSMGVAENADSHSRIFADELRNLAEGAGLESITKFVEKEANLRNEVLYASDKGVPTVEFSDALILNRLHRVNTLHMLVIAI